MYNISIHGTCLNICISRTERVPDTEIGIYCSPFDHVVNKRNCALLDL